MYNFEERSDVLSNTGDLKRENPKVYSNNDTIGSPTANGDQKKLVANFWNVLSFGICVAASNAFIDWSSGFEHGYWNYLFATIISSSTFICLHLCLAEMVGILPFSGGTYGFARVTVGPFVGFLVGCFESVGNIVYTFIAMIPIGTCVTYITDGDPKYEPIYWLLAYALVIGIEFLGRRFYFQFLNTYAFGIIMLVILYFILSVQNVDLDRYLYVRGSDKSLMFKNGVGDMMPLLPISGWYYFGIEIMPLISNEVKNAKEVVPKAIVATIAIITVTAFIVMLLVYNQYPGYVDDYNTSSFPLNSGYMYSLNIPDKMATILSMPALYISNAIYIFGYGKQLCALSKSKLLPSFLCWTMKDSNIPYMALLTGSLIGFMSLVILIEACGMNYFSQPIDNLFNAALMGSYFTFMTMFISFIIFTIKFSNLKRTFRNPLGIFAAIYGMIGLSFMFSGLIGFTGDHFQAVQYFAVFIGICSVYYFCYARYRQIFSDEEQSILFVIYLMKANQKKNQVIRTVRKTRINSQTPQPTSSFHSSVSHTISRHLTNFTNRSHTSPLSSPTNARRVKQEIHQVMIRSLDKQMNKRHDAKIHPSVDVMDSKIVEEHLNGDLASSQNDELFSRDSHHSRQQQEPQVISQYYDLESPPNDESNENNDEQDISVMEIV